MLNAKVDKKDDRWILTLSGDLDLQSVTTLHAEVLKSLEQAGSVTVVLESVGDLDLSAAQVFIAAGKTAEAEGKTFTLAAGEHKDRLAKMLSYAGIAGLP